MPTKDEIIEAVRQVYDPEVPVNVYDLGLVYDIETKDKQVDVKMTLTSQGCPAAQQIPDMVRTRVLALPEVDGVNVVSVFPGIHWVVDNGGDLGLFDFGIGAGLSATPDHWFETMLRIEVQWSF